LRTGRIISNLMNETGMENDLIEPQDE